MTTAGQEVPGGVVKVIELVGSSQRSFSDAVRNAVQTAAQTIRNIRGVDVISSSADVDGSGVIANYKVNCKVAFLVEGRATAATGSLADAGEPVTTPTVTPLA